jgi:hypothetical protein
MALYDTYFNNGGPESFNTAFLFEEAMSVQKKQFKAALIQYKHKSDGKFIWFWINPNSGAELSPRFETRQDAEDWFDTVINIHEETYNFIDRIKNGNFYSVKGRIDIGDAISSKKANDCPFTMHLEDDILELEILATSYTHAKERAEEYFEILEWIE